MEFIKKHEKLSHLTDEQIEELIRRYYEGERAKILTEEYKIDISSSKLYTLFPPEICEDIICPYCNVPMVCNRESKSSYTFSIKYSWSNKNSAYCYLCGHILDTKRCNCINCVSNRQEEARKKAEEEKINVLRKRQLIEDTYSLNRHERVEYDLISFRDKVYLGALLRSCLSEDLTTIYPIDSSDRRLAPTNELTHEMVISLINKNIIVVDPTSSIDAFTESSDTEFPNLYYTYKVKYHLNLGFPQNKHEFISSIMNPKEFNIENTIDAYKLWKDIALAESLEYFDFQMKSVGFDFNPGEKTLSVFNDLISLYAVSQVYGIIYKSVAQGTKFYQEGKVTKKQAANSVIGSCQRLGERANIQKWDLGKYNRVKDCSQSMLSEFFFNRVIKIGDYGFNEHPSEYNLQYLLSDL